MRLIVNGRDTEFVGDTITYSEVVALAGKKGNPTVIYHSHPHVMRSGEMHGGSAVVRLEPGMVFTVVNAFDA